MTTEEWGPWIPWGIPKCPVKVGTYVQLEADTKFVTGSKRCEGRVGQAD